MSRNNSRSLNMPLQIRRGTNAQRQAMTQALAQGELLYVTDDQRLYIGNGSTLGGIQITGYTDEDAQDAAAQLFTNGAPHTGITFSYNDAGAGITAVVDLLNNTGTIGGVFKGNVVAEDSTLLIDAASGQIFGPLTGNVTGNVTGNLTGNVTGNLTGNVTGNLTGNVTGNTNGYHTGDAKGSVFGDDSSIIVNAIDNSLSAISANVGSVSITGNNIISSVGRIDIGSASVANNNTLYLYSQSTGEFINQVGISDPGSGFSPWANFKISKGTLTAPTVVAADDVLSGMMIFGYDGTDYRRSVTIGAQVDTGAVVSSNVVPGKFLVVVQTSTVSVSQQMTFNSKGVLEAPVMRVGTYANNAARDAFITAPAAGMIVFNTTGTKFQGYTGAAWVDLN